MRPDSAPHSLSASVVSAQTPPPLQQPHETGQPPQKLGQVSFATSCDPKLGPEFNRAVPCCTPGGASVAAFTAIAEKDPACGMAWWGVGGSRWGNPFAPARPPAALKEGGTAIAKAVAAGAKTDRERVIQAVATLFADFETVDQRTRTVNYARDGAGGRPEPRRSRDCRVLCPVSQPDGASE